MAHRSIGQERLGFSASPKAASTLDELLDLIDWAAVATTVRDVHASAKGEAAWPPLSMFKAMPLSVWCDLSEARRGAGRPRLVPAVLRFFIVGADARTHSFRSFPHDPHHA